MEARDSPPYPGELKILGQRASPELVGLWLFFIFGISWWCPFLQADQSLMPLTIPGTCSDMSMFLLKCRAWCNVLGQNKERSREHA